MNIRPLALASAALLALTLMACGDATTPADTTAAPDAPATTAAPVVELAKSPFVFTAGAGSFAVGESPAVLTALGEPLDKLEAASCVHEGFDRIYYYAGFEVNTVPTADGREVISSIYLTDDSVTTAEGIYIGATLDMVKSAYAGLAADAANPSLWCIAAEGGAINFLVDAAGVVTSIYYN